MTNILIIERKLRREVIYMYDKVLAGRIMKILKKKAGNIVASKDSFESAITGTEMISMLDLLSEVIGLDIETIKIKNIKKEG